MQEMWNCIELHSRSLLSPIFTIDSGRVASDDEISPAIILLVSVLQFWLQGIYNIDIYNGDSSFKIAFSLLKALILELS